MRRNSLSTEREEGHAWGREHGDTTLAPVPREEVEVGAAEDRAGRSWFKVDPVCTGAQSCTVLIFFSASIEDESFEEAKDTSDVYFREAIWG